MFTKTLLGLSTCAILVAAAASADTQAAAWTDLNVRSGPGPMYSVVGVIPANEMVMVQGCLDEATWCQVTYGDVAGWSAGNYLTATAPLSSIGQRVVVKTVTYDHTAESTVGGLATGAFAGALIAGPVGAVVGGIIGAATGSALAPDPTVISYVKTNPVDPVYLDGEVVLGAEIPDTVNLVQVPESQYSYAYINGVRVLVETDKRAIVYIVR